MAIAKSADGQAAAATITLASTGVATGDLVIVHAYRNGSTAVPSSPGANWTDIATSAGANTNSRRIGYRVIQAGDNLATIVGTWTNATAIQFIALTGYNPTVKIGARASGGSNTATLTTPAVTLTDSSGNSWVVAFAGSKSTNANSVTLSSTTDEGSSQGALNLATGRGVTSYASRAYSATVNASANRMDAVEVIASIPQNPQPTGMATTFTGGTPTVTATDNKTAAPTALATTFTGATPTVTATSNVLASPTPLALTLTGATPTVTTSDNIVVLPGSMPGANLLSDADLTPLTDEVGGPLLGDTLTFEGAVPAIAVGISAMPTALSLSFTGSTPTVATPIQASPAALGVTWAGDIPTVLTPIVAVPAALDTTWAGAIPAVNVSGGDITVTPSALAVALAFATPVVTVSGGIVANVAPQGALMRRLEAVPYVGPTVTSRTISKREIAAARRRFERKRSEEEWLLGLVDQLEAA